MRRRMSKSPTTTQGTSKLHVISVEPVPASRPRVPRFGRPYYTGRYKSFREELEEWIEANDLPEPLDGALSCVVVFVCKRPKKLTNPYPRGDVDNYLKAVFDSLQGHAFMFDDKQVSVVLAIKRYAKPGEEPHITIRFWREDDREDNAEET